MASRMLDVVHSVGKNRVMSSGYFQPQSTTQLTSANYAGRAVASVTRTGVGAFTITLQDPWPALLYCDAHFCSATRQSILAQIGTVNLTAKTITVFLTNTTTGAAADVTGDANTFVRFLLYFRNTTIPGA